MRLAALAAAVTTSLLAGALGCDGDRQERIDFLEAQLIQTQQQTVELQRENQQLAQQLEASRQQTQSLMDLGERRLEQLYHVERISLGRYTGGVNTDETPGDEAIRVYISPIDQHGSTIKAAGSVNIAAYDLAAPQDQQLVAQCEYGVDEVAKAWSGGFGVYHYSFTCPWTNPPQNREITIRVTFTEYLTGKTFTQQTVARVALARESQTAPAAQQ